MDGAPAAWLDRHGDALYRYAYFRLRDPAVAEDLVQETLLAALAGRARFREQAAERTWLIAILKNKLADHLRKTLREAPLAEVDESLLDELFDQHGHWQLRPSAWPAPERAMEQQEFWRVLTDCLQRLPARQAQAFLMKAWDGAEADDMCKVLATSTTNLWVMLHRARLQLRACIEAQWFIRD